MKFQLIKAKQLLPAKWAGGTTTQLAIYPEGTEYSKFNFIFRMSYATVEVPSSTFTFMPGVTRHLMILEGALKIDHTGRYKKNLVPFDKDIFDGEWPTSAEGMVKDFNLMTRNGAAGNLHSAKISQGKIFDYHLNEKVNYAGIYFQKGSANINVNNDSLLLEHGDFLFLEFDNKAPGPIQISASANCEIILAEVSLS
jgi:uncharacterized protein